MDSAIWSVQSIWVPLIFVSHSSDFQVKETNFLELLRVPVGFSKYSYSWYLLPFLLTYPISLIVIKCDTMSTLLVIIIVGEVNMEQNFMKVEERSIVQGAINKEMFLVA